MDSLENLAHFKIGEDLRSIIEENISPAGIAFQQRDFVTPLMDFCNDGRYDSVIGIVFGLRSTGKTVGMLQVANELIANGCKVAYATFKYEEAGVDSVNEELLALAKAGYKYVFMDEASYLGGFLNTAAVWADTFVPQYRMKIVICGTDSFLLWASRSTSLLHRHKDFSTSWLNYAEFKRVINGSFEEYSTSGGIFEREDMNGYILAAIVDNVLHTIEHLTEDANRRNAYTDRLYGIGPDVMFKAVISIFKSALEEGIKEHFAEHSGEKNIADLQRWSKADKREIKERIAENVELYRRFTPIKRPNDVIEAIIELLTKIDCLVQGSTALSDIGYREPTYYFTSNALLYFSIAETINGVISTNRITSSELVDSIKRAGEGLLLESIVYAHVFKSAANDETVFKYSDISPREIDVVAINRKQKTLRLIEVKSKTRINPYYVCREEAGNLYSDDILKNIGIDDSYTITRILVYQGENMVVENDKGKLLIANIEDFLLSLSNAGETS